MLHYTQYSCDFFVSWCCLRTCQKECAIRACGDRVIATMVVVVALNKTNGGYDMTLLRKHKAVFYESFNGISFEGSTNSAKGYIFELSDVEIVSIQSTVRKILEVGYAPLGGTRADLDTVLSDKDSLYRVFSLSDSLDDICAVQVYKVNFGVPRLRYIAGQGENRSKGVYALIEYEIKTNSYCCFAEVSDAIAHMYAKSNGYIVPNIFASKILKQRRGIEPVNDNLFEYVHTFPDGSSLKKMLFGFKSLESYEKFSQKIKDNTDTFADYEGYEDFRAKANAKIVALRESHDRKRFFEKNRFDLHDVLETAEAFLVNLVSLHDDYQYNEFPEETFEQASYVLEVIKKLGTPSEYEESKSLYDYWISNVKVLKPIMFSL